MPIRKFILILSRCYVIVCSFVVCSVAALPAKLSAVTEELVPYQYFNEQHQLTGFVAEVITAIAAEAGVDIESEVLPWSRAYARALAQPNTLIYSIYRNEEREDKFNWIIQVDVNTHYFFALKSKNLRNKVTLADLQKQFIGVPEGSYEQINLAKAGFTHLMPVDQTPQLVDMLVGERIDLLFGSQFTIAHLIAASQYDVSLIEPVFEMENWGRGLYIAASIGTDNTLIDKLQRAFERLQQKGIIAQIKQQYLPTHY